VLHNEQSSQGLGLGLTMYVGLQLVFSHSFNENMKLSKIAPILLLSTFLISTSNADTANTKLPDDFEVTYNRESRSGTITPPFLMSARSRELINYSNCLGGTPPITECGRSLL